MGPDSPEVQRVPSILHVDMDAFYASVEQLEYPELRNRPVIVGGDGLRGVVASCSYEARFYGVRSAMPSVRAKRLCPRAIFIPGHYGLYEQYSRRMHDVFERYTPHIEPISLDEAFLDVAGAIRLFGSPEQIAHRIRTDIRNDLGLNASVGVATSKHLAKLGSQAAKPKATANGPVGAKGVVVITDEEAIDFLHRLPVRALWGVGPASAAKLEKLGITTVAQLAHMPVEALATALGRTNAQHLHDLSWNRDKREVVSAREAKSVGHEQTFPRDLHTVEEVHAAFVRLCDAVASRLRGTGLKARTVTAKVRFGSFKTVTRSKSLEQPTSNAKTILSVIDEVTGDLDVSVGVRLLGVSTSNFDNPVVEGRLSVADDNEDLNLDDAIDRIREKYGRDAVAPAQLIGAKGADVLRKGERQWGPSGEDE